MLGNFLIMERDSIVMLVAHNIQAAMARRGTNPAEVARLAGINATGVYDIMSGKSRSPRLDTIGKIAKALNMPIAALFEEPSDDELRQSILDAVYRLPPADRQRMLTTARAWAESTQ